MLLDARLQVVVVVVMLVVVVVVVGHGPQSCGHVEQSSEGPQKPSPHTWVTTHTPPGGQKQPLPH